MKNILGNVFHNDLLHYSLRAVSTRLYSKYSRKKILGSASRAEFPVFHCNRVGIKPWLLYSRTHQVLSVLKLVELKVLDCSDLTRTGFTILTSAADMKKKNLVEENRLKVICGNLCDNFNTVIQESYPSFNKMFLCTWLYQCIVYSIWHQTGYLEKMSPMSLINITISYHIDDPFS